MQMNNSVNLDFFPAFYLNDAIDVATNCRLLSILEYDMYPSVTCESVWPMPCPFLNQSRGQQSTLHSGNPFL